MNDIVQYDLWGNSTEMPPRVVKQMTTRDKVLHVLREYPETRSNDRLLILQVWDTFSSLRERLGEEAWTTFSAAFSNEKDLTGAEDIRRRRASIQNDDELLLPPESVQAYRRQRAKAGPPGPRG